MKNKQRKQAQRKINSWIRAINEGIRNDNLWRGRFVLAQIDANWERFDDNSGGCLTAWIEIRDLKTGLYYGFTLDNYDIGGWRAWNYTNKFIVDYSRVWDNIQEVKDDKTDYSKVKWIPKKAIYY